MAPEGGVGSRRRRRWAEAESRWEDMKTEGGAGRGENAGGAGSRRRRHWAGAESRWEKMTMRNNG